MDKPISRRRFLSGLALSGGSVLLAACGSPTVSSPAAESGAPAAPAMPAASSSGGFDWMQENGKTISLAFAKHPMSDTLIQLLPEFKSQTGITVNYEAYPEEEFFQKLLVDLSTRQGTYDAFMCGPVNYKQYAAPGWIEPLDGYLSDPKLTASDYDLDDFYPAALGVNRWDKEKGLTGLGQGPLYAIPVNEEGYSLFSRKDVLEKAGIKPPESFAELLEAATKLNGFEMDGKKLNGFVARGNKTFPTLTGGFSSLFWGYGASDLTADGKVDITSAKSIEAHKMWGELMSLAPQAVGSYTWYEAMNDFAAGNAVFFIDANHMAEFFEDPTKSAVAGKVNYGLPPAGPDGTRACGIWLWSLGMSSASQNKNAAWLFLQWASSKAVLEKAIPLHNINPTRQSLANSPTMKEYTASWGNYNDTWQTILADHAKWRYMASPKFPEIGDRWALGVQQIILKESSAEDALAAAASDIEAILAGV
ncbi:MAG: sugar ABC transporter substrate-binding protein [Roseiflexaceae bacterium]|nr:sugar ABC transporter substrate-binding protein [Roseiflexaceae bacterium]